MEVVEGERLVAKACRLYLYKQKNRKRRNCNMANTNTNLEILSIQNRIHLLTMRDPVINQNIIRKLTRRLKKLEG